MPATGIYHARTHEATRQERTRETHSTRKENSRPWDEFPCRFSLLTTVGGHTGISYRTQQKRWLRSEIFDTCCNIIAVAVCTSPAVEKIQLEIRPRGCVIIS